MPSLGSAVLRSLALITAWTQAQTQAQNHEPNVIPDPIDLTCDARTINYITHTLPQACLTSSWTSTSVGATPSDANSTAHAPPDSTQSDAPPPNTQSESQSQPQSSASTATPAKDESEDAAADGDAKPFMSFEDWKAMMLKQTGQDPKDLQARNAKPRDRTPPDMGYAGLGEEDEISLNFGSYMDDTGEQKERPSDVDQAKHEGAGKDGRVGTHRNKDAGKTCKERFSYSSFDAGATILKTSPGARNAKAILVENKDSYLLFECSAKEKWFIVELSDDVLIDTVVLANFEFFSSMIQTFTVSVSDRYPVKMDEWKQLGTFQAENSRAIQPFLIQNPQIFSKYVRIDYLTHYGKQYYCPVSLLRIHGSRFFAAWNEARDEDASEEAEEAEVTPQALPSGEESTKPSEPESPPEPVKPNSMGSMPFCEVNTASRLLFEPLFCSASLNQTTQPISNHSSSVEVTSAASTTNSPDERARKGTSTPHTPRSEHPTSEEPTASSSSTTVSPSATPAVSPTSPSSISSSNIESASNSTTSTASIKTTATPSSSTTSSTQKPSPANTVNAKKGSTGTASGSPASPTVQEGFFKSISKRLTIVETNLTLSLKYVEDQARHMSETLHRTEQKQLSKTTLFLENLNKTVLAELRSVREQYDQIWQSTVLALESQREQSNREIVALSARLNLLADEVVFQKRMAIIQAVLLMSCLILVIFSRGVPLHHLAPFSDQASLASYDGATSAARVRAMHGSAYDGEDASSLAARQRAQYAPTSRGDDGATELHRGPFADDMHHDRAECEQLSPPPTPRSSGGFSSSSDLSPPSHDTQPNVLRRSIPQPTNSRKPLPALPENPSSP
ncbi:UNC-like C-terminal-domain-containing protein [Fusarium redolens]|uniref:UNC-like C-terminal-domain-containing protein n=1 Tax=Fusarium redolens TaxID=48865 RepID=A0A9P9GTD1_FUSRE|nr:UNC-like C-terminal-domain-containing protein [Fusarium redolens]KAH7244340.1 UNC-like C-terminal-domain-containing protein [Fusarium redolens]